MRADAFAAFPPRPRDVGEWEDLLLRYELGPRAVRLALQDHPGPAEGLSAPLARLAAAERFGSRALDAMRRGGPIGAGPEAGDASGGGASERFEEYAATRARNFAALQRRGLGVWEWRAALPEGGEVTAHQLVRFGLQADGEALASIRDANRGASAC